MADEGEKEKKEASKQANAANAKTSKTFDDVHDMVLIQVRMQTSGRQNIRICSVKEEGASILVHTVKEGAKTYCIRVRNSSSKTMAIFSSKQI